MRKYSLAALTSVLVACTVAPASAGVILQDSADNQFQIQAFEPLGQSFTAIDTALTSIGFKFTVMNPGFSVADPVMVSLYSGVGTSGTLLASRTLNLPANANAGNFTDFDFSGISTTVGQQYSAVLSIVGNSPYFGVETVTQSNSYAGGSLFTPQTFVSQCNSGGCDVRFRITGVSGAVPEPATWAMMLIGFGAIGASMRRRRRVNAIAQMA